MNQVAEWGVQWMRRESLTSLQPIMVLMEIPSSAAICIERRAPIGQNHHLPYNAA